jgi:hypothetical protein
MKIEENNKPKNKLFDNYRISRNELSELYSVDKKTITNWASKRGLPLITLSTHSQFVRIADLLVWENSNIKK